MIGDWDDRLKHCRLPIEHLKFPITMKNENYVVHSSYINFQNCLC